MSGGRYRVHTDGASRGNPGPAAIGVVITDGEGTEVAAHGEAIGSTTNNVAEYRALLKAIEMLRELRPVHVDFRLDSELIVRQLGGQYKVRDAKMKLLYEQVRVALTRIPDYTVRHVRREDNRRADALANEALDRP